MTLDERLRSRLGQRDLDRGNWLVDEWDEVGEVPVVETSMTVDITPDQFAAQREAMILELAKKYGVDPSLITLEANAARRRLVERRQLSSDREAWDVSTWPAGLHFLQVEGSRTTRRVLITH